MTDEQIYCHYLETDQLEIGRNYHSPLRSDRSPSLSLYSGESGDQEVILWKDHGLDEPQQGHFAIHLIMHAEDVSYSKAKEIKKLDLLGSLTSNRKITVSKLTTKHPNLSIRDHWEDFELKYWSNYGIDENMLLAESIWPCERLSWSGKSNFYETSRKYDPIFIYLFADDSWKKYRPYGEKGSKWASWNISGVIEGYNTLADEGELLLIWKGTKDRVIGKKLGFNIINPTAEGHPRTIFEKKYELEQRFDRQIIMFDADEKGFEGASTLSEMTGWEMVDTRGVFGSGFDPEKGRKVRIKDFAQYRLCHGEKRLLKLINKLI